MQTLNILDEPDRSRSVISEGQLRQMQLDILAVRRFFFAQDKIPKTLETKFTLPSDWQGNGYIMKIDIEFDPFLQVMHFRGHISIVSPTHLRGRIFDFPLYDNEVNEDGSLVIIKQRTGEWLAVNDGIIECHDTLNEESLISDMLPVVHGAYMSLMMDLKAESLPS